MSIVAIIIMFNFVLTSLVYNYSIMTLGSEPIAIVVRLCNYTCE